MKATFFLLISLFFAYSVHLKAESTYQKYNDKSVQFVR